MKEKESVSTYYSPRTRTLNENTFISGIGARNDVLNIFNSQESLKNISNKNGVKQKSNTNLYEDIKIRKERKNKSEEILSSNSNISNISNKNNKNENSQNNKSPPIEIMKDYKGVFSVDNSIESSANQTKESIEDINYQHNKKSNGSINKDNKSKSNSKESIFDKLLESIDSEEMNDSNVIFDNNINQNNSVNMENSNIMNDSNEILIEEIDRSVDINDKNMDEDIGEINIVD
eukprot:jgi/Orpsp1_1/1178026/evm.model.c7180000063763.2